MSFRIIRNDITKMQCDAIVNTANNYPTVGAGCDSAIYNAAGFDKLLQFREENIGIVEEGEAFITPGFQLSAKYIIHTVSPLFIDGKCQEEEKLRACYKNSLKLAIDNNLSSIAFPLIATGSFGYPKEEGMRIAIDEISGFLLEHDMEIYLVVFDEKATNLGKNIYPDLELYIDSNYVNEKELEEYCDFDSSEEDIVFASAPLPTMVESCRRAPINEIVSECSVRSAEPDLEELEAALSERMKHLSDTFSQYLLYLIELKGMTNAEVYNRAIVDKKVFSKIKNNPGYHPQKLTAMCLCVGAKLNLDETKDLLARAGYALSPCEKTDIIFTYFIERGIYDMIELDIQLEEHGLPCIIS